MLYKQNNREVFFIQMFFIKESSADSQVFRIPRNRSLRVPKTLISEPYDTLKLRCRSLCPKEQLCACFLLIVYLQVLYK